MNFANVMVVMVTDKLVPSIEATSLLLRYVISRRTDFHSAETVCHSPTSFRHITLLRMCSFSETQCSSCPFCCFDYRI